MSSPFVISVILNTNNRDDTLACLESLAQNSYAHHEMIVLDNASTDGSVEAIHSTFPQVEIVELKENRGYAGNNNVGMQWALDQGADWVFVLNEDTILAPDCIERLVEIGGGDEQIGVVGPQVYHHDEPDVIQSAGGRLGRNWRAWHIGQNERDHGQYDRPHEVDWVSGCAILFRRQVLEQVGLLDERFFYYWEETELCLRARNQGWRVVNVPQARLWHKGVQQDYTPSPSVTYYATRNRFLMLAKHGAPLRAWLVAGAETLRTLVSWSVKSKWYSRREHRDAMWQGALDFFRRRSGMRIT